MSTSDPDYVVDIHSITITVTIQTSHSSKIPVPRKGFAQRLMRHVLYIFCFYLLTSKLSPCTSGNRLNHKHDLHLKSFIVSVL